MTEEEIIRPENLVYKKPTLLNDTPMHYCPGCSHGVVHKLVAEVIEEMGMENKTVAISPVGCAVFAYNYIDVDWVEAAHGRAPAVASAIKRLWPDRLVFTYQGDGDLACIGTAESIHALNRGEHHHHLHQQRHLRHDGRTNGSHDAHGNENRYMPLRSGGGFARLPFEVHGNRRLFGGHLLRHPPIRPHRGLHPKDEKGHPESF